MSFKPGKVSAGPKPKLFHDIAYQAVDHFAPGLGKKQKAEAANRVAKLAQIGFNAGKKVVIRGAKNRRPRLIGNIEDVIGTPPSGFHDFTNPMAGRFSHRHNSTNTFSTMSNPNVGLGGSVTSAPVSLSHNINRKSRPSIKTTGDSVFISHSEMLGSIVTGAPSSNTTAFRCVGMRANPGMANVFPWLSATAVNYEKYRFRKLRFTIVPLVSTAFNGRIGVGFDYDSSDLVPGTRQEFYSLTTHAENMPWQGTAVDVKCDGTFRFTGTHVAADNKLIDLGQVVLMSDAVSNGATISSAFPIYDLIVDYVVELIEPQQALFATQLYAGTTLVVGNTLGVSPDAIQVFGPNVAASIVVTSNTILTMNIPTGTYAFSLLGTWATGGVTVAIATAATGATIKSNVSAGTSFAACFGTISTPVDAAITFTTTGVSWSANLTKFDLTVSRVASQVASGFV